ARGTQPRRAEGTAVQVSLRRDWLGAVRRHQPSSGIRLDPRRRTALAPSFPGDCEQDSVAGDGGRTGKRKRQENALDPGGSLLAAKDDVLSDRDIPLRAGALGAGAGPQGVGE